MQCMEIWSHHHAVTTITLVGPDLESQLKSLIAALGAKWYHHAVVEALNPHKWLPHPLQKAWKVIVKKYMLRMGIWNSHLAVTTTLVGPNLEKGKRWNQLSLLGAKWYHHALVEALNPHGMVLISTSNKRKVIYNLHMLWMGIWSPHCAVTTIILVGLDFESQLKSIITAGCRMIPSYIGRGSKPIWNGSHIHSKQMKSDWQTIYAMTGDMD